MPLNNPNTNVSYLLASRTTAVYYRTTLLAADRTEKFLAAASSGKTMQIGSVINVIYSNNSSVNNKSKLCAF